MNELDAMFALMMLGFLAVFAVVIYQYKNSKVNATECTPGTIVVEERAGLPFYCGECGMGMKKEDYSCPRCLSRDKRRR